MENTSTAVRLSSSLFHPFSRPQHATGAGMMAAATYVHSNTAEALAAAGRDFPGWPLFLTGHSMGGLCKTSTLPVPAAVP